MGVGASKPSLLMASIRYFGSPTSSKVSVGLGTARPLTVIWCSRRNRSTSSIVRPAVTALAW